MIDLNRMWLDFECPKCAYINYVQIIDIKTEKTIFCNNCKVGIKLNDNQASVHNTIESINNQMREFENIFKKIGK